MNTPDVRVVRAIILVATLVSSPFTTNGLGQSKRPNPASKLFISDVGGDAQIDTGESVEDLSKRSVYRAQGTVIETKKQDPAPGKEKVFSTMVFSNGTGAFFDADTRVEVRRFVQEPFVPTRSDSEVEPSISQTQVFVSRGTVGLCPSKLVAGSVMSYTTPFGSVNVSGRKLVVQADENMTKISILDGESTVKAGALDMGGHTLHAGEQAIIRPTRPGQPNTVEIVKIPPAENSQLEEKVAMACMAKKTVYFEVRGRQQSNAQNRVDAFNDDTSVARRAGDPMTDSAGEIVAVPVVPANLPVQFVVSPASLTTPSGNGVNPGQGNSGPPGGN